MRKGLSGNIKHSNGLLRYGYKRKNELRNIKRRQALAGYPKEFIFTTEEEINEYFSGDTIICLMCGHSFRSMTSHLDKIHGMSTDDYKTKYGLPFRRGLVGQATKEKFKKEMNKRISEGLIDISPETLAEHRKTSHLKPARPFSAYRKNVSLKNINKALNLDDLELDFKTKKVWTDEDYYRVLDLSEKLKVTPLEIMQNPKYKVPKRSAFHMQFQKDEKLRERYYTSIERLPGDVQAKHRMIGRILKNKLAELRSQHWTHQQIANELKISIGSVINIVAELELPKAIKNHCHKGHPYSGDSKKCLICPTDIRRKKGVLPKSVARTTLVEKPCFSCGEITLTIKMGRCCCKLCKRKLYEASQKKYALKDPARRKEMDRISRKKRKERKLLLKDKL